MLAGRRDQDLAEWRREALAQTGREQPAPWRRAPSIEQVEAARRALREADEEPKEGEQRKLRDVPWLPPPGSVFAGPLVDWRWGLAPVEQAINLSLDVLRTAIDLESLSDRQSDIREWRLDLHAQLAALRQASHDSDDYWRRRHELLTDPRGVQDAVEDWKPLGGKGRSIIFNVASILRDAGELVAARSERDAETRSLHGRLVTLTARANGEVADQELTVRRLLALDVIQRASGAELAGIEQTIELVLMSADTGNAFDLRERAEEKLAGLQVAHFGSFYKRSWRANDWMWGRLDGADRVTRTLFDPRRIRRRMDE